MRCRIKTEGFGDMVFDLFPELAPITVKNFAFLIVYCFKRSVNRLIPPAFAVLLERLGLLAPLC